MSKYRGPLGLILAAVFLIYAIQWGTPKKIDWTENYEAEDKRPYGDKVLVDLLADVFPGQTVNRPTTSLHKRRGQLRKGNYLIVNHTFFLTRPDLNALLEQVKAGSNAFIVASILTEDLADTLEIFVENVVNTTQDVQANFVQPNRRRAKPFAFTHVNDLFEIIPRDSGRTAPTPIQLGTVTVSKSQDEPKLGTRQAAQFVAMPWGKGHIFLHVMPQAFGNYNMVHPDNAEYIAKALSYLPTGEVFWEEYYTDITYASRQTTDENGETVEEWDETKAVAIRKNDYLRENDSIFRFFLDEPPLRWAVYLTLFGLVLFVFFEAKRRQRIVPVIKPLANATLEFTTTVGRLYFQHQDHKNIAEKKITYFLEYIRNRYYLTTNHWDDAFYTALSRKSGMEKSEVEELFRYVQYIQKQGIITEEQLLQLNTRLQRFLNL
jgi:hypothetical protein